MAFGVVKSDGDVTPFVIFPHHLKLPMEAYIKCLEELMLVWNEMVTTEIRFLSNNWTLRCAAQAR